MQRKHAPSWEPLNHRPKLPEGWGCIEQLSTARSSSTSFVRWAKVHHNGEPQRIWVVFVEHRPGNHSHRFVVYGGRNTQGENTVTGFHDLKSATARMVSIMEATDRWVNEINSEKFIKAYNDRIAAQVKADEKRREAELRENQW